ncbi:hypothetical protein HK100_000608 [Physocladia obscura]|uniref:SAM domain-containing protein n=1 Tax=Physocladia obscura TaxID=109957 RepID=A0AAD5SZ29_9FUNG|nr:hypothetical protein HK100_000608 [Physocladia obscura]
MNLTLGAVIACTTDVFPISSSLAASVYFYEDDLLSAILECLGGNNTLIGFQSPDLFACAISADIQNLAASTQCSACTLNTGIPKCGTISEAYAWYTIPTGIGAPLVLPTSYACVYTVYGSSFFASEVISVFDYNPASTIQVIGTFADTICPSCSAYNFTSSNCSVNTNSLAIYPINAGEMVHVYSDSACTSLLAVNYWISEICNSSKTCFPTSFGNYHTTTCGQFTGNFLDYATIQFKTTAYVFSEDFATYDCSGSPYGYETDLLDACIPSSLGSLMYTNSSYYGYTTKDCSGAPNVSIPNSAECAYYESGSNLLITISGSNITVGDGGGSKFPTNAVIGGAVAIFLGGIIGAIVFLNWRRSKRSKQNFTQQTVNLPTRTSYPQPITAPSSLSLEPIRVASNPQPITTVSNPQPITARRTSNIIQASAVPAPSQFVTGSASMRKNQLADWTVHKVYEWARVECSPEIADGLKENKVDGAKLINLTTDMARKILPDIGSGEVKGLINKVLDLNEQLGSNR